MNRMSTQNQEACFGRLRIRKVKKALTDEEVELIRFYGANYLSYSRTYRERADEIEELLRR